MKNTKKYNTDFVIIGGGISGLYAAKKCIAKGYSVLLLEKASHLGGRIHTIYHSTYHIEAGAGRFNQNHIILRGLLKEYGLTEVPITSKRSAHTISTNLLRSVINESKRYDPAELINMTFKAFCEKVIGKVQTKILINTFGYNGEFEVGNAAATIEMMRRDFLDAHFYTCKEGLSELVRRMEVSLIPYTTIYKSTTVTGIESKADYCVIHAKDGNGETRRYIGKNVIAAIPQADLKSFEQFTSQQRTLLNGVAPISLNRVYGEFPHCPRPWFHNIPRTTTENKIRQFIPIDPSRGVAMVSYSDTRFADYWKRQSDKGADVLKKTVLKNLHAVFPDVASIPKPDWIGSYYWPAGVHMWKPGVDSSVVIPQIQNIMRRVHIVGEAYCKVQGWIEGALESVEDVFRRENI